MTDDEKKKTEETALAVKVDGARVSLDTARDYADVFIKSGLFQDTKDEAQAIVKVLAGREIGIEPLTSMTGIHLIKGKIAIGANLMASAVKKSNRYNFKVVKHDDKECIIDFYEDGEKIGTSKFTIDEAFKAGLNMDMYKKYPKNMLYARAMSNGVKWYCPDVFGSPVYTPEELKELDFPEKERETEKKGRVKRGEQTPSPVHDAEFKEVKADPSPVESQKADSPAPVPVSEPVETPKKPEEVPEESTTPTNKFGIKVKPGMIAMGMSPRSAYGKIQEHCFRTNQSPIMNKLVMDVAPDCGDYTYQMPESACAKIVKDITGIQLKLIEKTPKCLKCDNTLTEPEAVEQEGLCQTCFKKKQDSE